MVTRQALRRVRADERRELLATLRFVGPTAPTLCAEWCAMDIAAHLVVSEASMGLPMVAGNALRRLLPAATTRRAITALQSTGDRLIKRVEQRGWATVLERLSAGPPPLYQFGALAHLRFVEEWIHHEDIRRANGMQWRPTTALTEDALWTAGATVAGYPEFLPGREDLQLVLPDGRGK